jgi:hypothetical protein
MTSPYAPITLSDAHRERVVQLLSAAFANDRLSMEQLDERLSAVYRAQSQHELEMLLADPSDPARSLAMEGAPSRVASPAVVADRGVAMALMGGFQRKGPWIVPRHLKVVAVMGGGELDLRDAKLGPGVTEIEIFTMWGGVEILVPDGVRVDVSGMGVMGGFSASGGSTSEDPNAPVLRVSGLAIMGGVDVRRKDRGKKSEKRYIEALERAEQLRTGETRALDRGAGHPSARDSSRSGEGPHPKYRP